MNETNATIQEEQKNIIQEDEDWLKKEQKTLELTQFDGKKLEALKLEEGKITEFEVDFSKPFEKWIDSSKYPVVIKKMIPVTSNGEKRLLWCNVKNPLYREIIAGGTKGITVFKVLRTGQQQNTRYTLL